MNSKYFESSKPTLFKPIFPLSQYRVRILKFWLQIRDQRYGEAVSVLNNVVQTYSKVSVLHGNNMEQIFERLSGAMRICMLMSHSGWGSGLHAVGMHQSTILHACMWMCVTDVCMHGSLLLCVALLQVLVDVSLLHPLLCEHLTCDCFGPRCCNQIDSITSPPRLD